MTTSVKNHAKKSATWPTAERMGKEIEKGKGHYKDERSLRRYISPWPGTG